MAIVFILVSTILLMSGLGVVLFRSPVHCALSLFVNLVAVAGIYAMLHAHFLMVVQLIVYAGAIVVLVLFVIMLLNIRAEARRRISIPLLVIGGVVSAGFLLVALPALRDAFFNSNSSGAYVEGGVRAVGLLLYSKYVLLVQMAGLLLLAATVGAVMIARRTKKTIGLREASDASG